MTRWFAITQGDKSDKSDKSTAQGGSVETFVSNVAFVASVSDEPEWMRENIDEILERAAIMEIDGYLPRAEAERLAREWYAPTPF